MAQEKLQPPPEEFLPTLIQAICDEKKRLKRQRDMLLRAAKMVEVAPFEHKFYDKRGIGRGGFFQLPGSTMQVTKKAITFCEGEK